MFTLLIRAFASPSALINPKTHLYFGQEKLSEGGVLSLPTINPNMLEGQALRTLYLISIFAWWLKYCIITIIIPIFVLKMLTNTLCDSWCFYFTNRKLWHQKNDYLCQKWLDSQNRSSSKNTFTWRSSKLV